VYRYGEPDRFGHFSVPGGTLSVRFVDRQVSSVWTNSPYFRTSDGIGVGSEIPLGPCIRTANNPCARSWKGFVYRPPLVAAMGLSGFWTKTGCHGGMPASASLEVRRGEVLGISVEYGGGDGSGCGLKPRRPLSKAERASIVTVVKADVERESPWVYVDRVGGFVLARSTRQYVHVGVSIRDKRTRTLLQGFGAILRRVPTSWALVTSGSYEYWCGEVPTKVWAEMGLTCS
jgi:hypothetical protein